MMIKRLGFAAAFKKTDGSIGYIDIDDHSGGYPYFSSSPPWGHIRALAGDAVKDIKMALKEMRTYYGANEVVWNSFFIVEIVVQKAPDVFVDELIQQELVEKARKTFTTEELEVLGKYLLKETK